jgi:hypothetical protein
MDTKKYFGILGFALVASLASTIIIRCVASDVEIIGDEFKRIFPRPKESK